MRGLNHRMPRAAPYWIGVGLVGLLAISASWLAQFRLSSPDALTVPVIEVISAADAGPGTLRDAILTAARADGRTHVILRVPRIVIETPLPPLASAGGIIIDGAQTRTELDGSVLGARPMLDIVAAGSIITGLRVVRAGGQALLVRQSGVQITRIVVEDSTVGVEVAPGVADVSVVGSTFDRNDIGLQIPGDAFRVRVQSNTFRNHRRAAVWAVSAALNESQDTTLEVVDNRFEDDEQSVVIVDVRAQVEANVFARARQSAVFVSATTAVVRGNRISGAIGFGIYGDRVIHTVIANNELDHNCAGGVMLRGAANTQVVSNRIYTNGSGIVGVQSDSLGPNTIAENLVLANKTDGIHLIGVSPVLRRNRLVQNLRAGLRLSTLVARGNWTASDPLMQGNVLRENGNDVPQRDYFPEPPSGPAAGAVDCWWRLPRAVPVALETL